MDTISHFQEPLYYLGELGWQAGGNSMDSYKRYRSFRQAAYRAMGTGKIMVGMPGMEKEKAPPLFSFQVRL
jgi:hypothetical protein